MTMTVHLVRLQSGVDGTVGLLMTPTFSCFSMELPWRDNRRSISRIPDGQYRVIPHHSPRFGCCYWVQNVPGRSGILIHPGNLAGDTAHGWRTHSQGCILLGKYRGELNIGAGKRQRAVLASGPTVREFLAAMGGCNFTLDIREV